MTESPGFGLYIHWPYCARICPYCDFNVYKNGQVKSENGDLVSAIITDMQHWRQSFGPRKLRSIHFGGGTPSLMAGAELEQIIHKARQLWESERDLEIALEANPGNVTQDNLRVWRQAGIERLSIGVQSFDNEVLKFLGRDHSADQARAGLKAAVNIMPRVSADMIYGWRGQTVAHLRKELETVKSFQTGHVSAYQLTIEAGTAFDKALQRGDDKAVGADQSADLFELTGEILGAAGYQRYEVSNFAKSIVDQSRHNKIYWTGGEYAGVGPGAHGRIDGAGGRKATIAHKRPQAYVGAVAKAGTGIEVQSPLSSQDHGQEYLLMGLRIAEGIDVARYEALSGEVLPVDKLGEFARLGLLIHKEGRVMATDAGRLVLDHISHHLL